MKEEEDAEILPESFDRHRRGGSSVVGRRKDTLSPARSRSPVVVEQIQAPKPETSSLVGAQRVDESRRPKYSLGETNSGGSGALPPSPRSQKGMPFGQVVIGPPGSGKSTYCYGLYQVSALVLPLPRR